ncbi:ABC transporter permease [Flavobacterium cerinum]|uniref:FtsX-like permease family protein n=1 Tax=Flavobacterium cerinum TaxID=2502784 RepID=A0A3S3SGQ2_9FLAO|nr:FtsX-like permease family protein [Flavobacterium cerinum]RWX03403.1 FtsX-like permease family protein [Flavobacterium cerinum]
MLKNWIKIFLYQAKNNKIFTGLNILGLAMGIAGLIFAILYWNDEHEYDRWNPNKENVFAVINIIDVQQMWSSNVAPTGPLTKDFIPEVESYCYTNNWYSSDHLKYMNKKILIEKHIDAQPNFFSFYPFEFIKGDAKTAIAGEGIALSEDTAKLFFGNEDPLNKQVFFGEQPYVVKGVYRIPGKSSFAPMVVTGQMDKTLDANKTEWGNFNFGLMLKLKDPKYKEKAEKGFANIYFEHRTKKWAQAEGLTPEEYVKKNGRITVNLQPMKDLRLHSVVSASPEGQGNYQSLTIMIGLSILILVLSVVNYVNLATANAIKRAKEIGIRKTLGASKGNIVKQFIFETVLIILAAILLALVIVELALPYYNNFLNKDLVIHGNQFYIQLVVIFMVAVVLAGIFPAVYVSNFETLKVLKGNFARSKNGVWLRNGMLILQFAIAAFFIIGSSIVYRQVDYMSTKELGFKGDQIVDIEYRNPYDYREVGYEKKLLQRYLTIKQETSKIKGVKQVSTGSVSFGGGVGSSTGYVYNNINVQGMNVVLDFDLLNMMQIGIIKGRNLSSNFALDTVSSILINETAARQLKDKNILGKEIDWNDNKFKIVGIVKDFHAAGPQEAIPPMTFFHYKTVDWMIENVRHVYVKVDPENMEQTIGDIEKFWTKKIDTEYPFKYDFVNKNYARAYENYVKQRNLFSLLNVVVILIALFGLFSLASYSIQRRMKEIAIRKTLGAETKTLLSDLSKQYIVFCIIGFAIALFPVYSLLDMWLDNFAYRVSFSIMPFILGFAVLLILTLLVVLSRAYQATRVNVLQYLKYE